MQGKIRSIILIFSVAVCWGDDSGNAEVHNATMRFSMELLEKLFDQESGNVVVSPVSVHAVLAMLQQGAGGNTKYQLDEVIHADENLTREGYYNITRNYQRSGMFSEIQFASRMFLEESFEVLPQFREILVNDFQSNIDSLNFNEPQTATQFINSWVAERTHNHIAELIEPDTIDSSTVLVLVNAIFFQSFWDNPFMDVEDRSFSVTSDEEKLVPTMHQRQFYPAGESSEMGAKWLHLTFNQVDDFTLLLVLPTERHGLNSLLQSTHEQWTSIFSYQDYKLVNISIPKFKFSTKTKLIPLLKSLGVQDMFGSEANFSGITTQDIQVSEFLQKATVGIDEIGVTASAATGVIYVRTGGYYKRNPEEMEFMADQPFLIFIIDRSRGIPLFAGRVSNPLDGTTNAND